MTRLTRVPAQARALRSCHPRRRPAYTPIVRRWHGTIAARCLLVIAGSVTGLSRQLRLASRGRIKSLSGSGSRVKEMMAPHADFGYGSSIARSEDGTISSFQAKG
jgi:hypothetical protein